MADLNLIEDPWIPVQTVEGLRVIRPDQMAEAGVLFPAWPRADLNLACLELLVGLAFLAMAPKDEDEWEDGQSILPSELRERLARFSPAFNLLGSGPRFLQENVASNAKPSSPDLLFIDSAGVSTAGKNADLMVRRERYPRLSLPLAAMGLYTLQSQAPSGGAGNRTSMRGGGPMVTFVRPRRESPTPLWQMIWANVPNGQPLCDLAQLPWMSAPQTSEKGEILTPSGDGITPEPETFFGMPRRLWLQAEGGEVTGVYQRPRGRNYSDWVHPMTPYYVKDGEKFPRHPKPGAFGYRNWRGILLEGEGIRAAAVSTFLKRAEVVGGGEMDVLVAGWATNNMTPVDFLWSEQPLFPLAPEESAQAARMVDAAEKAASELVGAVRSVTNEDWSTGAPERARERFFTETQDAFEAAMAGLLHKDPEVTSKWHAVLRRHALEIFGSEVLPGLADLHASKRESAVKARNILLATFLGHTKNGRKIHDLLGLTPPSKRSKSQKEAAVHDA